MTLINVDNYFHLLLNEIKLNFQILSNKIMLVLAGEFELSLFI